MTSIKNIAIVGSGNIANFLAGELYAANFNIKQIISRNVETGQKLATFVKAEFSVVNSIGKDIDLVLICVPDDQIALCAGSLNDTHAMVCHCAGSIDLNVLERFSRRGILYPLQSISQKLKDKSPEVPFLIEASADKDLSELEGLLNFLNYGHTQVNSKERLLYHLAAVFANNFTNAMIMATQEIVETNHLDFSLLKPLIFQTFDKLKGAPAMETQTGPAKRHDLITIKKHLDLLKGDPAMAEIYHNISLYITDKFKH